MFLLFLLQNQCGNNINDNRDKRASSSSDYDVGPPSLRSGMKYTQLMTPDLEQRRRFCSLAGRSACVWVSQVHPTTLVNQRVGLLTAGQPSPTGLALDLPVCAVQQVYRTLSTGVRYQWLMTTYPYSIFKAINISLKTQKNNKLILNCPRSGAITSNINKTCSTFLIHSQILSGCEQNSDDLPQCEENQHAHRGTWWWNDD